MLFRTGWAIKTIVSGHGDTQMRLGSMAKLGVAAGLMMHLKSGFQQRTQYLFRL